MAKAKLTAKQERFCQEYIKDLNASAAARRATYSERSVGTISDENMHKPVIIDRIAELQKKTNDRIKCDVDDIVNEMAKLAMADHTEIGAANKIKALETIGRRHNAFEPKQDAGATHDVSPTIVIQTAIVEVDEKMKAKVEALAKSA